MRVMSELITLKHYLYIVVLITLLTPLLNYSLVTEAHSQYVYVSTIVWVYSKSDKSEVLELAITMKLPARIDAFNTTEIPVSANLTLIYLKACGESIRFSGGIKVVDRRTGLVIGVVTFNNINSISAYYDCFAGYYLCGIHTKFLPLLGWLIPTANITEIKNVTNVAIIEPILRLSLESGETTRYSLKFLDKPALMYLVFNEPKVVITKTSTTTLTKTLTNYLIITKTKTTYVGIVSTLTKYVSKIVTTPKTVTVLTTLTIPISKTVYHTVVKQTTITVTTSLVKTIYTATLTTSKVITLTVTSKKYVYVVAKLNELLKSPGGSLIASLVILAVTITVITYLRRRGT